MYLGGSATYAFHIGGDPITDAVAADVKEAQYTGLFSYCKEINSSERQDDKIKFLIVVPQTYFDHPSLIPDLTQAITRQQYIDEGLVKYTYVIETDKINDKIAQLKTDLGIFKKRIDSYDGDTSTFPNISQKINRVDTFISTITSLLKINGEEWRPAQNDEIELGLDENFEIYYVTYGKEGDWVEESDETLSGPATATVRRQQKRVSRYLLKSLSCINQTSDVFQDTTTSAYLFYADQIQEAIKKKSYPGIELVQKFTVPLPTLYPSKKTTNPKKVSRSEQEKDVDTSLKKPAKDKDQIIRENTVFGNPTAIEEKAQAALDSFTSSGTDFLERLENLVKDTDDIWSLFENILNHIPLMDFITRAALCLVNKIGFDDLLENILNQFIKLIKFHDLLKILLNEHIMELMELGCPDSRLKIEEIIFSSFEDAFTDVTDQASGTLTSFFDVIKTSIIEGTPPDFEEVSFPTDLDSTFVGIFENIVSELKRLNLLVCLLKTLCEALKQAAATAAEDLSEAEKEFLKIKEGMPFLEALDCDALASLLAAGDLDFAKAFDADEIVSKNMEQIGFELPELEYSDDPFANLDEMIYKAVMTILNEVLVPIIINILEQLLASCEGLDAGAILGDDPPENVSPVPSADDLEAALSADEEYHASPVEPYTGVTSNFPGETDILDLFDDLDNTLGNILNNESGLPTTQGSINELTNLLNVLSNILKPTEICTLLSASATSATLNIILQLVKERPEFSLLASYFKTTDDIAQYFGALGDYTNKTYCATAVRDISLISVLCETELNDQFYCDALKQKGFSSAQCEKIIKDNKNRDKEKLAILQEMLAAPDLSAYFQNQVPPLFCTPDSPGILPINDDYLNSIIDMTLDAIFGAVKAQFNAEAMGAKSALVKEVIIPYGGPMSRPPEVGRDYVNPEVPIGSTGTPSAGLPFYKIDDETLEKFSFPGKGGPEKFKTDYIQDALDAAATAANEEFSTVLNDHLQAGSTLDSAISVATLAKTTYLQQIKIDASIAADALIKNTTLEDDKRIDIITIDANGDSETVLWDDIPIGTPIMQNWPKIDIVERQVAPRFVENANINEFGAGLSNWLQKSSIDVISIDPASSDIHTYGPYLFRLINVINVGPQTFADVAAGTANIEDNQLSNLIEYQVPVYNYLKSEEGQTLNLPDDFSRLVIKKIPLRKEGSVAQTTVINILESISDQETLNLLKKLVDINDILGPAPGLKLGPMDIESLQLSLQEYSFAKMLSWSLWSVFEPSNPHKIASIIENLEGNLVKMFPFVLAHKQDIIIKECLKSRLFDPRELDKLLVTPATPEAIKSIICSDYPNKNLDQLRKGLLDFDDIKEQVKEFYNAAACETHSRSDDEPDPLDDAIRYGMVLIFIRLLAAEIILRSIFFFSRFSATQTIVDSSVFTSLMRAKIKRNASQMDQEKQKNPSFYQEIKDIAYKKLRYSVTAKGEIRLLSNTIIFDDNKVVSGTGDKRQITNFSEKIYNIDDLSVLEQDQKTNKVGEVGRAILKTLNWRGTRIFDNMEAEDALQELDNLDEDVTALLPYAIPILKNKFNDLAIKYIINNDATRMAPHIDSIFLDKDRIKMDASKTLLASNQIFDVPSSLWRLKEAREVATGYNIPALGDTDTSGEGMMGHLWDKAASLPDWLTKDLVIGVDFQSEQDKIDFTVATNTRNICLDAYADNYRFNTNATIFDDNGLLTPLGKATKAGGFIVQKYVEVKMKSQNTIDAEVGWAKATFEMEFRYAIGADAGGLGNRFILSYKNFDFAFKRAQSKAIDTAFSAGEYGAFAFDELLLSELFEDIRYGLRLVYVFPHELTGIVDPGVDILDSLSNNSMFNVTRRPILVTGEGATVDFDLGSIDNFLLNTSNDIYTFINRGYQIKELKRTGIAQLLEDPNFTGLTEWGERIIVPIYMVPIVNASVDKEIPNFSHLKLKTIKNLLPYDIDDLRTEASIIEKMGVKPKELLSDLFEKPEVKIFNDYIVSSTNLLNFAVLQQAFFPYSNRFDFDNLFAATKDLIQNTFSEATTPKNDHTPAVDSKTLETWADEIDKSMSGLIPAGALYEWLTEAAPKWILRFFLKTTDPCMKEAFEIQEEKGWSDEKLPEIIFGSLFINPEACASAGGIAALAKTMGIDLPSETTGNCMPGIRPTPLFPPFPPFMGDPTKSITAPGMIYAFMQFLVGYKAKYETPGDPETPVVDVTGEIPDLDLNLCAPNSTLNEDAALITEGTTTEE